MDNDIMQMSAGQIISELWEFSKEKLKLKDDLERIIDISLKESKMDILEEAAFTAKFLQGLFSIIQRGESSIDENVLTRYMKEYNDNIGKVKINLKEILSGAGSFINNIFEEKYFALSQESLSNLNNLCYDLGWYKMYLNNRANNHNTK